MKWLRRHPAGRLQGEVRRSDRRSRVRHRDRSATSGRFFFLLPALAYSGGGLLSLTLVLTDMRKQLDPRIPTLIDNGVKKNHRSFIVLVGDKGRDQVNSASSI